MKTKEKLTLINGRFNREIEDEYLPKAQYLLSRLIYLNGDDEIEQETDKHICKMCKKPVGYEEWDNFSGCHSRCENQSYDCLDKEGYNENR